MLRGILGSVLAAAICLGSASAQTTQFSYQGSLKDGANVANGSYDLEFRLYDSPAGGSQIGSANSRNGVSVTAGIFSVDLDFGAGFPGGDRYLEISVKAAGGGSFTVLSPRQRIASSPYSIKSLNATSADIATNASIATTAGSSTSFTGALNGDVTGTQSATTVARLRGTNVATTTPTNNQVLKFNSATNQWQPGTDDTGGGGGGGTITGVTAGTGLTGGGTTGTVTVAVANNGIGTLQIADGSITDLKIVGVSGGKVTGTVANATSAATAANSVQLGGIAANQYVQTNDARLTDARSPTANSPNYIQNTGSPQAASNFNITGNGIVGGILNANIVKTDTDFRIGPFRVLGADGTANLFAGIGAGSVNSGTDNAFFGRDAGRDNTSGLQNSFFGSSSGKNNVTGFSNSFFGSSSGLANTATGNSFFGALAGLNNTSGGDNSFFGRSSGLSNTTATGNAFFGAFSGAGNTTGADNAFFGSAAGSSNTSGQANAFFGSRAGQSTTTGTANTFIGRDSGSANTSGGSNTFVGIRSGQDNTTGTNMVFIGRDAGANNTTGFDNTFVGAFSGLDNLTGTRNTLIGIGTDVGAGNLSFATAIGSDAIASSSNSITLGRSAGQDTVRIPGDLFVLSGTDAEPGSGGYIISGSTSSTNIVIDNNEIMARNNGVVATLAINADGGNVHLIQGGTGNVGIGTTSPDQKLSVNGNASKTGGTSWAVFSDERLKNIKGRFSVGLDAIRSLQPIRFEYKADNVLGLANTGEQIGFSAQEVQKVIPEAVTTSREGYLQLNVDPILWAMVNGIKEQDVTITDQQKLITEMNSRLELQNSQIKEQAKLIAEMKTLLCGLKPDPAICRKP